MTALAYPRPARLPAAVKLALLAVLGVLALVAPRSAHASKPAIAHGGDDFKRGAYAEFSWRPALVPLRSGVMPAVRTHMMIGARLAPRLVLGTMGHMTIYTDQGHKPAAGIDFVMQLHVVRGLFLRAGAGVISNVPQAVDDTTRSPGYGGMVGAGYQFKLHRDKPIGLALGADYDLRVLRDRHPRGVLVVGLSLVFG